MRINATFFIILISCLNVFSKATAQKINVSAKATPLETVLKQIEKQSGYAFMFEMSVLEKSKKVSCEIRNADLNTALNVVFSEQPLEYQIISKTILIKPKKEVKLESVGDHVRFIRITGKVTDKNNISLEGVNIRIKGTNTGTITDQRGNYAIEGDPTGIVIFSYVGFQTIEIRINGQSEINMTMVENTSQLDQIQIIGYGTTVKRYSTGNISTIRSNVIANQPVTNPLQALSGRVAGLQITQANGLPGTPITVQIRGRNSIAASNNPLYIIDGVPFTSISAERINGQQGASNPMNMIEPNNIESIEVLKDADATAIYGSRAANGVILISTKKGRSGKTKLNFDINSGFGSITRMPKTLNTQEYLQLRKDAFANSNLTPNASNAPDLLTYDQNAYFDWQGWYMRSTTNQTNASIQISGGNQQTNFLLSGSYHRESTIREFDDGYKRGNIQLRVGHTSLNEKFKLNISLFYTVDKNRLKNDLQANVLSIARSVPNYPLYDLNGKYNWVNSKRNFISTLNGFYKGNGNNLNSSAVLSYNLLEGLDLKGNFGFNRISTDQLTATPSTAIDPNTAVLPSANFGTQYIQSFVGEPQITYNKKIDQGDLSLLLGSTIQQTENKSTFISVINYNNDLLLENPGFGTPSFISGSNTTYKFVSVFSRLTYNWKNKYVLNATFRRDGSSRFGPSKQFGNFGSIGAAWLFTNEEFVKNSVKWLSYGKLRSSYGSTGNDGIGDYGYLSLYNSTALYGTGNAIVPSQLSNKDFQWEINKKMEISLDLGFANDNILLNSVWYRNRSGNQLIQYDLPSTVGLGGFIANLPAIVENSGWEFELNTINIKKNNFNWSSSINLTIPKNKLISFPGLEKSSYGNTLVIGKPLNNIQRFNFLGIDPATGLTMIEDLNKDGIYTQKSFYNNQGGDYIIAGTTDSKWYGGVSNTITYKGFQIDVFFQFTKQQGYNLFSQSVASTFGNSFNVWTEYLPYWKAPNDQVSIPKPFAASNISLTNFFNSSAGISDASFIRLKNVSLSYNLPNRINALIGTTKLRVYMQGQNIWTLTKYKGYDPETAVNTTIMIPPLKLFTAGIQCEL